MRQTCVLWSSAGSASIPLVRLMKFNRRFVGGARGATLVASSAAAITTAAHRLAHGCSAALPSVQCAGWTCRSSAERRERSQQDRRLLHVSNRSQTTELRELSHRLPKHGLAACKTLAAAFLQV